MASGPIATKKKKKNIKCGAGVRTKNWAIRPVLPTAGKRKNARSNPVQCGTGAVETTPRRNGAFGFRMNGRCGRSRMSTHDGISTCARNGGRESYPAWCMNAAWGISPMILSSDLTHDAILSSRTRLCSVIVLRYNSQAVNRRRTVKVLPRG